MIGGQDADESIAMGFLLDAVSETGPASSLNTVKPDQTDNEDAHFWKVLSVARRFLDSLHSSEQQAGAAGCSSTAAMSGDDLDDAFVPRIFSEAPRCAQAEIVPFDPMMHVQQDLSNLSPASPGENIAYFVVCKQPSLQLKSSAQFITVDNSNAQWIFNPQKQDLTKAKRYRRVNNTNQFLYFNTMTLKSRKGERWKHNQQKTSDILNVYYMFQRALQHERLSEPDGAHNEYTLADQDLGLELWVLRPKEKELRNSRKRRLPCGAAAFGGAPDDPQAMITLPASISRAELRPRQGIDDDQRAKKLRAACWSALRADDVEAMWRALQDGAAHFAVSVERVMVLLELGLW